MAQEIRVMKPQDGWPISRTNGGTAGIVEVMAKPVGENMSHYVTGFLLTEGADGNGFSFIRQAAIKFSAANNTVTSVDGAALEPGTNDFSFALGLKVTSGTVTLTALMSKDNGSNDGYIVSVNATGHLVVTIGDGTAVSVTSLNKINDGKWHQIVVTVDRDDTSGLVLYIDGVISKTANPVPANGSITAGSTNLIFLGTAAKVFWISTWGFWKATLLTAAQVTAMWRGGSGQKFTGSESGLTHALNFEEGTSHCADLIGALTGTLANGTWVDGDGFPLDRHTLKELGVISCQTLTTTGGSSGVAYTFPHAIKIGRNAPIRLLETDGTWHLLLFGYTDGA